MPDNKNKTGKPDRIRINVQEDYELRYWTQKLGVSADILMDTVAKVGPMVADVQKALQTKHGDAA